MKRGLTLIEVLLSITLISLIAISILPGITFGYKNLIDSKKFTVDVFESQLEIEKIMEEKRNEVPSTTFSNTIFGVSVEGHSIEIPVKDHGEIYVFQTERKEEYPVPKIVRNIDSGLPNIVRLSTFINNNETLPVPISVNMFTGSNQLDNARNFLVDSKYYKIDNPKIHLVNVYRWYTSSMVGYSEDSVMDNYFIIKEWNAARPLISYEESKTIKTIPNIQNDPDYNRLKFTEIKNGLGLGDTELINQYGNRYYYFSITPFAISGKIGIEEYSNAIYVNAPRIEIDKAIFGPNENQVSVYFKDSINDVFVIDRMSLNESLGNIVSVSRDATNDKVMIIEFDENINQDSDIEGNTLHLGSVESSQFGAIYIWSPNNEPSGEFTIYDVPPIPVTSVSIEGEDRSVLIGETDTLTATVDPSDATNKKINWTSSDSDIVSVDENGLIKGLAQGTATVRATSDFNPTIFDEVTITVLTEEDMIVAELEAVLANINSLTVNNPTNASPTIVTPSDSNGIVYTLTSASPTTGTPRISINSGAKSATVYRSSSNDSGTIKLTATKNGVSLESGIFNVEIPRDRIFGGRGSVTVTK